ncbi:DEKNAAC101090 [Brettanomyces naardenensis]|uniref:DEKNAAC101090 n=1 Tax=Brettanomyces naardenensis TaxID=13370 RepID=A0A448YH68_BRENA|nr:DEKNAAC101090 [Brettanomyces naardenensis]
MDNQSEKSSAAEDKTNAQAETSSASPQFSKETSPESVDVTAGPQDDELETVEGDSLLQPSAADSLVPETYESTIAEIPNNAEGMAVPAAEPEGEIEPIEAVTVTVADEDDELEEDEKLKEKEPVEELEEEETEQLPEDEEIEELPEAEEIEELPEEEETEELPEEDDLNEEREAEHSEEPYQEPNESAGPKQPEYLERPEQVAHPEGLEKAIEVDKPIEVDEPIESNNENNADYSDVVELSPEATPEAEDEIGGGTEDYVISLEEPQSIEPESIEEPSEEPIELPQAIEEPSDEDMPQVEEEAEVDVSEIPSDDDNGEAVGEDDLEGMASPSGVAAPALEDITTVASFYNINEALLHSVEPAVFHGLLSRFSKYQSLKSLNQMMEVSLEQLKHSAQSKVAVLTSDLQTVRTQLAELQQKSAEKNKESKGEEERLSRVQEEINKGQQVLVAVRAQLDIALQEKKNAYDLLSRKQEQLVDSGKEAKILNDANKQLRAQINESENGKEKLKSEVLKERMEKNQSQRELELSKQSATWFSAELSQKTEDLRKLRDEKRSEIFDLRSRLDKAENESSIALRSRDNFQHSLEELRGKFDEGSSKIKELSDKLSQQEQEYISELAKKEQLITVLQNSSDDRKRRVSSLQKMYDETTQKVADDEASYRAQFESLKDEIAHRESKIKDLEETVNDLTAANVNSSLDTSNILGSLANNGDNNGGVNLTPSAQKVLKGTSYSLTEIVSETNQLRKNLGREKRARQKAEQELAVIFKELDRRMPLLRSYKEKCSSLEMKQGQFEVILDNLSKEKSMLRTQLSISSKKADELQQQVSQLAQYKVDLQRQVATLLAEITAKDHGEGALSREEKFYVAQLVSHTPPPDDPTDTGRLISERLTTFKDIAELIEKNEQLLAVSRNLGAELENREGFAGSAELEKAENDALEKSKKAILKLQEQLQSTRSQLEAASNSRDMLQRLVESGKVSVSSAAGSNGDSKALNERINRLVDQVKQKQQEYSELKKQYDTKSFELSVRIQDLISQKSEVSLELARAQSSIKLMQERAKSAGYMASATKTENDQLKQNSVRLQDRQAKLEARTQQLGDELLNARSAQTNLDVQLKSLSAEKSMWLSNEERIRVEMGKLTEEKGQANALVAKLQTLDSERQLQYKETIRRLNGSIDRLQQQLDSVREKLDASGEETKRILHSKNADAQSYQSRIDELTKELNSVRDSLRSKSQAVSDISDHLQALQQKYDDIMAKRSSGLASIGADTSDDAVAALKQELSRALEDSKMASQSAIQYKQIASASEKELNTLNETYTQYKFSAEEQVSSTKSELDSLKSQLDDLTQAKTALEGQLQAALQKYAEEKQVSDAKISELSSAVGSFESIKSDYEARISGLGSDVSSKDELLMAANEKALQMEAAADSATTLNEALKQEVVTLQEKIASLDSDLKAAGSALSSTKESWAAEKAGLEEQLRRDKLRVSELDTQNRTLMNQLESTPFSVGNDDGEGDLKNLLAYLHRENDSLSQQLDYSKSEEKRLQQSVDISEKELSEIKLQLVEAKERAVAADKYTGIFEKMKQESQELAVYKENNQALRDEVKNYLTKTESLEKQYSAVVLRVEPLQQQVAQLHSEIEAKDNQLGVAEQQLKFFKAKLASSGDNSKVNKAFEEEKEQLVKRVADLEKEKNSLTKSGEQLQLYQAETARLNGEVRDLRAKIASLNEEMTKKVEEAKKNASVTSGAVGEGAAEKARDEFRKRVHQQEMEAYKKKLEDEKEAYKKHLASESESFKKKVQEENEARLQNEMESYKKRVRAPSNARISEVIEQRWKARSAELDSQYDAKVKELEAKSSAPQGGSTLSDAERKKMREELDKEKEQVRSSVTASVRRETQFRENILKRQLSSLKQKVKQMEQKTGEKLQNVSASAPAGSASSSGTAASASAGSPIPTRPAKRGGNDGTGNKEKRPKTE